MPQETNLNVSPYFDDFDRNKNYYKVLFKPGLPVQARELTSLQSILQDQVEQIGTHLFKEGSMVIPGQINYNNELLSVEVEEEYLGINIYSILNDLVQVNVRGANSNVTARILYYAEGDASERDYVTLFINYTGTGVEGKAVFDDDEVLLLEDDFIVIMEIDWQGALNILKAYPKAESVFISPPSIEDLRQRLLDRGLDSEDVINQRVSGAEKEILQKTNFKHEIINFSLDTATKKLINIIFRENHG